MWSTVQQQVHQHRWPGKVFWSRLNWPLKSLRSGSFQRLLAGALTSPPPTVRPPRTPTSMGYYVDIHGSTSRSLGTRPRICYPENNEVNSIQTSSASRSVRRPSIVHAVHLPNFHTLLTRGSLQLCPQSRCPSQVVSIPTLLGPVSPVNFEKTPLASHGAPVLPCTITDVLLSCYNQHSPPPS